MTQFLLQSCKYASMGQRTRPSQGFLQDFPTTKSWQALVTVVFVVQRCFSSGPLALSRLQPAGDRQIRMVSFSRGLRSTAEQAMALVLSKLQTKSGRGPVGGNLGKFHTDPPACHCGLIGCHFQVRSTVPGNTTKYVRGTKYRQPFTPLVSLNRVSPLNTSALVAAWRRSAGRSTKYKGTKYSNLMSWPRRETGCHGHPQIRITTFNHTKGLSDLYLFALLF